MFNGTGQGVTGGSQANGGVDDLNNNGGSIPTGRYASSWTQCSAGNNYCGTGLTSADAKDDVTGLIWSLPCNGAGCTSFSNSSPLVYSWDNSAVNNSSKTAYQLCNAGTHGQSGWALPHQKQLMQAYIDGSVGNLIDGATDPAWYWSASTKSWGTTFAWTAILTHGTVTNIAKNDASNVYVRCIR